MTGERSQLADEIWRQKYQAAGEQCPEDTWRRVAEAIACAENEENQDHWSRAFFDIMRGYRFLPGGRILANAGMGPGRTLFNCFVMDTIQDSMDGIFRVLGESALTMQHGGGIGLDFSTLRPAGSTASHVQGRASGPVSFMRVWESMCSTLLETNARRGAMMATLRCDHPDIEAFIDAKRDPESFIHFNLSVLVTDAFMAALQKGTTWPLVFPDPAHERGAARYIKGTWPGYEEPVDCAVLREIPAESLWKRITRSAYESSEPGVLFIDRINGENNLAYREHISATNPCGEIPLPPNGACDLGSINLARFVIDRYADDARLDTQGICELVPVAVRFLDNVIDISRFPLPRQADAARGSRRIGLGVTGLGEMLVMLNLRYDSNAGRDFAAETLRLIRDTAYRASVDLAREKGTFPQFREDYMERPFIKRLPDELRTAIRKHGIRNSHLLAIAPTGSISLLAGNVSSGIEPIYAAHSQRRVRDREGSERTWTVDAHAIEIWRRQDRPEAFPEAWVTAEELSPQAHIDMQAALQPLIDNAISKTINVPARIAFEDYRKVYQYAFDKGVKGCTTYRPSAVRDAILSAAHGIDACCEVIVTPESSPT